MSALRVWLSVACLLLPLTACEETPTGRKQLTLVPSQQMAEIGSRTFAEMLRSQPLVEDQRVLDYVGCVTRAFVDVLPAPQGEWSVAVFQEFLSTHPSHEGRRDGLEAGMEAAVELQRQALAQGRRPPCRL